MAATISVSLNGTVSVVETFTGASGDTTATFPFTNTESLTAATSTPVTKFASGTKALVAGAGTLSLIALPGITVDELVDATGLRLQIAGFRGAAANANLISIIPAVANGYTGLGTDFKTIVKAGQWSLFYGDEGGTDVGPTNKDFTLAGTLVQQLEWFFVFG